LFTESHQQVTDKLDFAPIGPVRQAARHCRGQIPWRDPRFGVIMFHAVGARCNWIDNMRLPPSIKEAGMWIGWGYVLIGIAYAAHAYFTAQLAWLPYSLAPRAIAWPYYLFG
jgi:hypothetical protein